MEIHAYDEVDPQEAYRLNMIAFNWPLTRDHVEHSLKRDPRVMDGYALYAVEDGKAVSQVVPLQMPVRLTTGVETVGAIAAVASHPSVWGKGYARALMERAHELYREEGLRLATLVTSPNIRGHRIYGRMGYVDLAPFYRGSRTLPSRRTEPRAVHIRKAAKKDLPLIHELYTRHTRGLLGWTERYSELLPMRVARYRRVLRRYRLVERGGEVVGYFRTSQRRGVLASELVLPRQRDFGPTVRSLEAKARSGFMSLDEVTSTRDQDRYRIAGYDLYGPMLTAVMALSLDPGVQATDLPELFGAPQGRFVLYHTDFF